MPKSVLPLPTGLWGGKQATATTTSRIHARYENALTNDENQRAWGQTDYFSAKAANNFATRRALRIRSRYELSNNPFLFGIANDNASDMVNTGPTLQCLRSSADENKQIERAWADWCAEVDLTEKLRTLKLAKTVDGEGFLILKTVKDMEGPVKLYPVDVEADQVTAYMPGNLNELWIDGLTLHPVTGRPVSYTVLRSHPGDWWFPSMNPYQESKVQAKHVVHWFAKFRPGQVRGVPAFTTSLDMFTELRSFRKAVLARANTAANLSAVLENTVAPADETGTYTATPFANVPIDRNTMVELPHGLQLKQFATGEPSTTYQMYQEACLGEACRPLSYPLNLALGSSQKFNFSSSQLDHKNYRNGMTVERVDCDKVASDKIFKAFIEEAALVPGLLPKSVRTVADVPHEWHWPGFLPLDPVADSTADHARLSNGTLTWQQFWASRGYDWREVMAQQDAERKEMDRLELVFGEPLKKTDKVDETAGPDGKPKPKGDGGTEAAASFPLTANNPDQPRDEDGRFAEGEGDESHPLDEQHEAEAKSLEDRHSDEEESLSEKHSDEDDAVERSREKEDKAEEKTIDKQHAKEDRVIEKREDKEDAAMEDRHEQEIEDALGSEEDLSKRQKAEVDTAVKDAGERLSKVTDKADLARQAAKEQEAIDSLRKRHEGEWKDRDAKETVIVERQETEKKAVEDKRAKEDDARTKQRGEEGKDRETAKTKARESEDANREKRQIAEHKAMQHRQAQEAADLDEKQDAERKDHDAKRKAAHATP